MLHKRTRIKASSSFRGYPSWVEVKSSSQRNAMCWHGLGSNFYIARLKSIINIRNPNFFERIVIYGETTASHFPQNPSYCREVWTSASPLCELMLTTPLPTGTHPWWPPPLQKASSAPLSPAWFTLSQQRARLGVGECFVGYIKEPK